MASDPRHCLALEIAYGAFDNSGQNPQNATRMRTACFTGPAVDMGEYKDSNVRDFEYQPQHLIMGISEGLINNFSSRFLGFGSPGTKFKTICLSSVVTLHLACQTLIMC